MPCKKLVQLMLTDVVFTPMSLTPCKNRSRAQSRSVGDSRRVLYALVDATVRVGQGCFFQASLPGLGQASASTTTARLTPTWSSSEAMMELVQRYRAALARHAPGRRHISVTTKAKHSGPGGWRC
jgi:hypothetical protein